MLKTIPTLIAEIRKNIQTTSAHDAYLSAKKEKSLFIDVREAQEVVTSPVINSVNIPRGVLEMNIGSCTTDEDQRIYLHCATGGRASLAAEQLNRLGYKNVWAIICQHNDVCSAQEKS
ncbi:rhodanese-like domain-containing protein [Colwellia sp. BRX8-4]|uniref:rhodanese-like domain-containing protein n=1 Tax=Colwellia sp. BRX8-4 TaxID=2759836 RepID=UPI0015F468DE|nr:rhodanese-like domain-containing protein [Colwellia sp. BRX8-4]MBA6372440.1 rhodanese-like domain-containing protein [Colwellia sp. BRX8-4]